MGAGWLCSPAHAATLTLGIAPVRRYGFVMSSDSLPIHSLAAFSFDQTVEGEFYAALIVHSGIARMPLRPVKAIRDGQNLLLTDPDREDKPIIKQGGVGTLILGRWTDRPEEESYGELAKLTWHGIASQAYGTVLRQRVLVERLAKVGIERDPERYLFDPDGPNAVRRSLQLNYNELDRLLTQAGV